MTWCLAANKAKEFKKRLLSGEISPETLLNKTSKERREYFKKFFSEDDAINLNRTFESKLLLKNKQKGMITWAQKMLGDRPEAKRDVLSRVNRMEKILNPETENAFLEELASYRLKTNITYKEGKRLSELATTAKLKKQIMENSPRRSKGGPATKKEFEYGLARVAFENYLKDLKIGGFKGELKYKFSSPGRAFSTIAGMLKSAKATFDNSWIGRQGWKLAFSHPEVWAKNSLKSFKDIWTVLRGDRVMDALKAEIYGRPNFEDYVKDKVAIGVVEEAFPESGILERIPILGRLHLAAEDAFTAMAYRNRVDLYDLYKEIALKSGIEETTGIGIGKLVNSLTSRGGLGKFEPAGDVVNNVLFSGRKLRSDWDFLTAHIGQDVSPFVKKQAAINLLKTISGTSAILTLANIVSPGSVNWNPTSSDFGQIKVNDTRFDITGGMRWIPILAARLADASMKTITG